MLRTARTNQTGPTNRTLSTAGCTQAPCVVGCGRQSAPFLFLHFSKKNFTEIYFWIQVLQFYTPAARQGGGRGPTARQVGDRDLYVNKKILRSEIGRAHV